MSSTLSPVPHRRRASSPSRSSYGNPPAPPPCQQPCHAHISSPHPSASLTHPGRGDQRPVRAVLSRSSRPPNRPSRSLTGFTLTTHSGQKVPSMNCPPPPGTRAGQPGLSHRHHHRLTRPPCPGPTSNTTTITATHVIVESRPSSHTRPPSSRVLFPFRQGRGPPLPLQPGQITRALHPLLGDSPADNQPSNATQARAGRLPPGGKSVDLWSAEATATTSPQHRRQLGPTTTSFVTRTTNGLGAEFKAAAQSCPDHH